MWAFEVGQKSGFWSQAALLCIKPCKRFFYMVSNVIYVEKCELMVLYLNQHAFSEPYQWCIIIFHWSMFKVPGWGQGTGRHGYHWHINNRNPNRDAVWWGKDKEIKYSIPELSIADLHIHDRAEPSSLKRELKEGTGEANYRHECTRPKSSKRQKNHEKKETV